MKNFFLALGLMVSAHAVLRAQGTQGGNAQGGVAAQSARGANTFHINGQVKNLQATRVYLIYINDNKQVLDSATVTNGTYVLTGEVADGSPATLLDVAPRSRPAPRDIARIYLTPESLAIGHVDSFSNAVVTGSAAALPLIIRVSAELKGNHNLHPHNESLYTHAT